MAKFPKTIMVTVALATSVGLLAAGILPQPGFKNLQVLPKNISKADLDKTMDSFKEALGVKCNYCHVKNAEDKFVFESDDKPEKEMTRKMMRMTHEINVKYFSFGDETDVIKAVTCYTCHYENPIPATDSVSFRKRY
jgi:hypothetical protein